MSNHTETRFIRRRGRIIPIKVKKSSERKRKAASFAAAGLIASLGAGFASGFKEKKAFKTKQIAFSFMSEGITALPKSLKRSRVLGLQKSAKKFSLGGQLLGGALLSQAIQQGLKSQGFESDDLIVPVGAEVGSQLAAGLIARQARKSKGGKFFAGTSRAKIKQVGKTIVKRFFSKQLRFKF